MNDCKHTTVETDCGSQKCMDCGAHRRNDSERWIQPLGVRNPCSKCDIGTGNDANENGGIICDICKTLCKHKNPINRNGVLECPCGAMKELNGEWRRRCQCNSSMLATSITCGHCIPSLICVDCKKPYAYSGKIPVPDFYQPRCDACVKKLAQWIADKLMPNPADCEHVKTIYDERNSVTTCSDCGAAKIDGDYWKKKCQCGKIIPVECEYCVECAKKQAKKTEVPGWDEWAFGICDAISVRSKDESTKLGSIILGPGREIRSTGYNSFPRGCKDDIVQRQRRPLKYRYFAHAEENAICNAARVGTPLEGCVIYCQWPPCDRCARMIIGAGIIEVKCRDYDVPERRTEEVIAALEMLMEAGVMMYGIAKLLRELKERGISRNDAPIEVTQ